MKYIIENENPGIDMIVEAETAEAALDIVSKRWANAKALNTVELFDTVKARQNENKNGIVISRYDNDTGELLEEQELSAGCARPATSEEIRGIWKVKYSGDGKEVVTEVEAPTGRKAIHLQKALMVDNFRQEYPYTLEVESEDETSLTLKYREKGIVKHVEYKFQVI